MLATNKLGGQRDGHAGNRPLAARPLVPGMTPLPLPDGIRSRHIDGVNGLRMHVLEAGDPARPAVLLLHGFPELAYSWRHVMLPLANAGFHVIAPDQRGYGRTTGWSADYDADLTPFGLLNLVRDMLGLLAACGHGAVTAVVGHDFGSPVAAWCALVRPDVFRSVVLMSAPFAGPPNLPESAGAARPGGDIHADLAALDPPRRHYQWWYSTREAAPDLDRPAQGLPAFLRAYYHMKSADWAANRPFPLHGWTAAELAKLPEYYVMRTDRGMAATVAPAMPSTEAPWLTDAELAVYAGEYARTGFQGGLNWYRGRTTGRFESALQLYAGRTIDVPSLFIAGAQDWGIHQTPGALARMQGEACTRMRGCHLIEGAGHWVQQEQAGEVARLLVGFCRDLAPGARP